MSNEKQSFDRDELRLLYEVTVADLTYFKTQQWSVTNYSLLMQAALLGVAQLLHPELQQTDRILLSVLSVVAAGIGVIVLSKLQRSISVRQSRLRVARDSFSNDFKAAWAAETKGQEYVHSIYFLYATVAAGTIIVCWLVLCRL